jgi:hypothetical protein
MMFELLALVLVWAGLIVAGFKWKVYWLLLWGGVLGVIMGVSLIASQALIGVAAVFGNIVLLWFSLTHGGTKK